MGPEEDHHCWCSGRHGCAEPRVRPGRSSTFPAACSRGGPPGAGRWAASPYCLGRHSCSQHCWPLLLQQVPFPPLPQQGPGPALALSPSSAVLTPKKCGCRPQPVGQGISAGSLWFRAPLRRFLAILPMILSSYCASWWAASLWHPGFGLLPACRQVLNLVVNICCWGIYVQRYYLYFLLFPPPAHASPHDLCSTCRPEGLASPETPLCAYVMC